MTPLKWYTCLPDTIRFTLLTKRRWNTMHGWETYTAWGTVFTNGLPYDVTAWMWIPHIIERPEIWDSPYRGAEYPRRDGMYVYCVDPGHDVSDALLDIYVKEGWYDSKRQTFGGDLDVLGWIRELRPYYGTKLIEGKFKA